MKFVIKVCFAVGIGNSYGNSRTFVLCRDYNSLLPACDTIFITLSGASERPTVSFVISFRQSSGNNWSPTGTIFVKFNF